MESTPDNPAPGPPPASSPASEVKWHEKAAEEQSRFTPYRRGLAIAVLCSLVLLCANAPWITMQDDMFDLDLDLDWGSDRPKFKEDFESRIAASIFNPPDGAHLDSPTLVVRCFIVMFFWGIFYCVFPTADKLKPAVATLKRIAWPVFKVAALCLLLFGIGGAIVFVLSHP